MAVAERCRAWTGRRECGFYFVKIALTGWGPGVGQGDGGALPGEFGLLSWFPTFDGKTPMF